MTEESGRSERVVMEGIHKAFPGVQALRGAHLALAPGEVHVLLGENGAGKSTLMKILCGQYAPDQGRITLDGAGYAPRSPHEAHQRGVAMIHQELSSIAQLTVAENLLLGQESSRAGVIDRRGQQQRARALLAQVGADFDPDTLAGQLSVAQRQLVEIAKALRHEARVLIMDEPTAALTQAETDRLFAVIRGLTAKGVAVVYISHRMPEIFAIGDRVTVMRDGATVDTRLVAETTVEALIAAMVGRPLAEQIPKRPVPLGEASLQVVDLRQGAGLGPLSFEVRAGEIFGLAGLMGSGRTEVARAIFGADRPSGGEVRVRGRRLAGSVRDAIDAGVGFVTEDRKAQGLVLDCTAAENITLAVLGRLTRLGFLDLPGRAADGRGVPAAAAHPAALHRAAGTDAVGRQPAEGGDGPLAGDRVPGADPGRADAGGGRGGQGGDLRADRRAGGARGGHRADLQRAARGAGPVRPHRGDARAQAGGDLVPGRRHPGTGDDPGGRGGVTGCP